MRPMIIYLCLGIFGCFILSGMAWIFSKVDHQPQFAVVDMQVLIAQHSQHLAKTQSHKKPGKVSPQQIQELSDRLKEDLESFATKHKLILLTKGSVMGGALPDYTDQFLPQGVSTSRVSTQDDALSRLDILDHSKSLFRESLQEGRP